MNNDILIVGKINGFYGLQGYVKVFSETRPRESILRYTTLLVAKAGESHWTPMSIADSKALPKNLVVKFNGFTDRTAVEHLLGAKLAIYRSQLPDTCADEYYWQDLIGLDVTNQAGELQGKVTSLMETGANDVLVIKTMVGAEVLVPFTLNHAVIAVDLAKKVVVVDWDFDDN